MSQNTIWIASWWNLPNNLIETWLPQIMKQQETQWY